MNKIKNFSIILLVVMGGCYTPTPKGRTSNGVKSISFKTKHYNTGRKISKDDIFREDITFNSSDKYISIENSKWALPLTLRVKDGGKVVWSAKLDSNDKEIKFLIPTDILKSGYRIEVESFTGIVMDSKVK